MTTTLPDLAAPVIGYAQRLHAAIGDAHHVASPLGAWLLLALSAPAAEGADLAELTEVLGYDAGRAARAAAELLASPHPLVAAAVAAWSHPGTVSAAWLAGLPDAVSTGPVPDQQVADGWAREHSFGMIERFPVQLGDAVYLVLASALATKVSWQSPFDLVPASALGPSSPWAGRLRRVLRTPRSPGHGHEQFIAVTPEAGEVAVHLGRAAGGLLVASVVAARGVPAADVLAAAHRLAVAVAAGIAVQRRSLFDLPLGDGPQGEGAARDGSLWTVREEKSQTDRAEVCTAVLPAWSAASQHDLSRPGLGFDVARRALTNELDPWQARQAAVARYTRFGFEAAAVTAMAAAASMRWPSSGLRRVAELRFGHPYAVVAVTDDERPGSPGPWHGVPVFSAWVTEPAEADDGG